METANNNTLVTTHDSWPWPTIGWWNPSYVQPAITYTICQTPRCAWCQGTHTDKCPDLKAVTYRRDGTVDRVEFFDRLDS